MWKKFTSFCQVLKKMHTKENWLSFLPNDQYCMLPRRSKWRLGSQMGFLHQFYKCGSLFDTNVGLGMALTSFLLHFPLFSNALLWVSYKILWELNLWGPILSNSLVTHKSNPADFVHCMAKQMQYEPWFRQTNHNRKTFM